MNINKIYEINKELNTDIITTDYYINKSGLEVFQEIQKYKKNYDNESILLDDEVRHHVFNNIDYTKTKYDSAGTAHLSKREIDPLVNNKLIELFNKEPIKYVAPLLRDHKKIKEEIYDLLRIRGFIIY